MTKTPYIRKCIGGKKSAVKSILKNTPITSVWSGKDTIFRIVCEDYDDDLWQYFISVSVPFVGPLSFRSILSRLRTPKRSTADGGGRL